ncbi:unnamed protein product, partial [Mesorhabditis spiculigera]
MLQLFPPLLVLIGISLAAPPAPPPGTLEETEMPFQANNVFIYAERICMINNGTTTWGRALEVFQREMCEGRALKPHYANIKTCFAGGRPDNQLEKALPKIKCSIAPLLYSMYFDRVVRDCPDESEAQHITVRAMINEATFYANWPQKVEADIDIKEEVASASSAPQSTSAHPTIVDIKPVSIPMPLLQQSGEVFVGVGGEKEAALVGLGLKKLRSRDKDRLYEAKRYAMDISIRQIMLQQQQAHQQNQQKQHMYAQALALMARVYVGSISFEVTEDKLRQIMSPFGPIKTLNMSWDTSTGHHKGYAFLEFDVPEAAQLAQDSMNGVLMGGRNLKLGRSSAATPQAQPIIDMIQSEARKYFRVYVASIHPDLSEADVKSVFEAFGEIVSCRLARNNFKGGHRGFGYIEFNNYASMNEAIAGMNMFDLGGQLLRVGRCVTPPEALSYIVPASSSAMPQSAALALAAVTAKVQAMAATQVPQPTIVKPKLSEGAGAPQKKNQNKKKGGMLDRIKTYQFDPTAKATFGAPIGENGDEEEEEGEDETLMITASGERKRDVQSLALSLIDKGNQQVAVRGGGSSGGGRDSRDKKKSKNKEPEPAWKVAAKEKRKARRDAAQSGPKLNTEAAMAAVEKAGLMNDAIIEKEVCSEEATLASQEGLEIRGNESRHLLMTKLMRINRSCILLLKNMVGPEDLDEHLEEEVKDECSKYGRVEEVLIVNDEANGVVKIFVRYAEPKQVDDAKAQLDNRFFAGRTISAVIYDQALYEFGDYSG